MTGEFYNSQTTFTVLTVIHIFKHNELLNYIRLPAKVFDIEYELFFKACFIELLLQIVCGSTEFVTE